MLSVYTIKNLLLAVLMIMAADLVVMTVILLMLLRVISQEGRTGWALLFCGTFLLT